MDAGSARLRALLSGASRVVALTGAGVSAESGVPTFRSAGGLWESAALEELATPEGFARRPGRVWEWYDQRRRQIASCSPNAGHLALAGYERDHPEFTLITQNVDGLHRAAGSTRVLALHGDIFRVRCTREGKAHEDRRVPLPEIPPRCECGALLRPDVVWFGELLPAGTLEAAMRAARRAELFLVIGTSALVHPAASLPREAKARGAYLVEINTEETSLTPEADEVIRQPAAAALPALLARTADP